MDNHIEITLIQRIPSVGEYHEVVYTEARTTVYGIRSSVSSDEWFAANRSDINSKMRVTIYSFEYSGQTLAEVNGTRYAIYRTYESDMDHIELYLEEQVGKE